MLIVIAGMGDVGFHLAKQLSKESHDIVAIDTDSEKLAYADSLTDILAINGSSTSIQTLKNAKIEKADLLVAVTSSEEVNIATAIFGKKLGAVISQSGDPSPSICNDREAQLVTAQFDRSANYNQINQ